MASKNAVKKGYAREVPPDPGLVRIYFAQKGVAESDVEEFLRIHRKNNWTTVRGRPVTDWKAWANEWIWKLKMKNRQ